MEFILGFSIGFFATRIAIRNWKVYKFRNKLLQMSYEWSMRHIDEICQNKESDAFEWLMKRLPGYFTMLFSHKELTLSAWLHEEAIRKLNS